MKTKQFIIFFIVLSKIVFSQQNIVDSLLMELKKTKEDSTKVKIINTISFNLIDAYPDSALSYARFALIFSDKIGFKKEQARSYNNMGLIQNGLGNYSAAINYFQKSLSIFTEFSDLRSIGSCQNNIGIIYCNQGKYLEAIEYYQKSLKTSETLKDTQGMATCLNNIGIIKTILGDYPEALDCYYKAINIYEKINNKNGMASCYTNIGKIKCDMENYKEALEYYNKSLKLYEEINNRNGIASCYFNFGIVESSLGNKLKALDYYNKSLLINEDIKNKSRIAYCLNNIGSIYSANGNYTLAHEYLQKSLKMSEELNDKQIKIYSLLQLGNVYSKQNQYTVAVEYFKQGIDLAKELGDKMSVISGLKDLAGCDSASGNFKEAYINQAEYKNWNDSLFNEEKNKQITNIEAIYKFDKLNAEKQLKDTKIKEQKKIIIIISVFLSIIILFSLMILLQYLQKIKSNKLLISKNLDLIYSEQELQKAYHDLKEENIQYIVSRTKTKHISSLSDEQKKNIFENLINIMEEEKIYKEPGISVFKLSEMLRSNQNYISQVINEYFNKNFNGFINEYRIKEAVKIMSDLTNIKYTIESIAHEVGFNSLPTFIKAFKDFTGVTPSFFLKNVKNHNQN